MHLFYWFVGTLFNHHDSGYGDISLSRLIFHCQLIYHSHQVDMLTMKIAISDWYIILKIIILCRLMYHFAGWYITLQVMSLCKLIYHCRMICHYTGWYITAGWYAGQVDVSLQTGMSLCMLIYHSAGWYVMYVNISLCMLICYYVG